MSRLRDTYGSRQPDGLYPLTNSGGILVYWPIPGDDGELITAWCNGDKTSDYRRHRINYTNNGRAYIWTGHRRLYLDTVMRTNW